MNFNLKTLENGAVDWDLSSLFAIKYIFYTFYSGTIDIILYCPYSPSAHFYKS